MQLSWRFREKEKKGKSVPLLLKSICVHLATGSRAVKLAYETVRHSRETTNVCGNTKYTHKAIAFLGLTSTSHTNIQTRKAYI